MEKSQKESLIKFGKRCIAKFELLKTNLENKNDEIDEKGLSQTVIEQIKEHLISPNENTESWISSILSHFKVAVPQAEVKRLLQGLKVLAEGKTRETACLWEIFENQMKLMFHQIESHLRTQKTIDLFNPTFVIQFQQLLIAPIELEESLNPAEMENKIVQLSDSLLDHFFPNGFQDIAFKENYKDPMWNMIQKDLLPHILRRLTDMIEDPHQRTIMMLTLTKGLKAQSKGIESPFKGFLELLTKNVPPISHEEAIRQLKEEWSSIPFSQSPLKAFGDEVNAWLENYISIHLGDNGKIAKHQIGKIAETVILPLFYPLILLVDFGWRKYNDHVSGQWIEKISRQNYPNLGIKSLQLVFDSMHPLQS